MDLTELIKNFAIQNRLQHGTANEKAVVGKILGQVPEARKNVGEVTQAAKRIVSEVNGMPEDELRMHDLEEVKKKEKGGIELENAVNVVMRFAPNPSGPLHIGHARAAILNDELVKKYKGKLILRIEDTDPKRVDPEAYDMIEDDLRLLGVEWHEKVLQSDRMDIYAEHCIKLIKEGHAYVCDCNEEEFKKLKLKSSPCPHRNTPPEENLRLFEEMKNWPEGRGSVKLKTDLKDKNPAVRDFPIMRVVERKHPKITGYRIYPLMNFSVAIDDHLLGMTHVLRGKDHIINTERQRYVYKHFNWKEPVFVHYGLMSVEDVISKTEIRKDIQSGKFTGWDDVGLWTIKALIRKGIRAKAIRNYVLNLGIKEKDIEFSPENLYAENKKIVEPTADRYYFVPDPAEIIVKGVPELNLRIPLHKDFKERGSREFKFRFGGGTGAGAGACAGDLKFYIPKEETAGLKEGGILRLMNFIGIKLNEIKDNELIFNYVPDSAGPMVELIAGEKDTSEEREHITGAKKIQWVYADGAINAEVRTPGKTLHGFCESECGKLSVDDVIQFERIGFCRLDKINGKFVFCLGHR